MSLSKRFRRIQHGMTLAAVASALASAGCVAEPEGRYLGFDDAGAIGLDFTLASGIAASSRSMSGVLDELASDSPFVARQWLLTDATYDAVGRFEAVLLDATNDEPGGTVSGTVRDRDGDPDGGRVLIAWRTSSTARALVLDRWLATRDAFDRYACWSLPGTACAPALGEPACRVDRLDPDAGVYALAIRVDFQDGNGDVRGGALTLVAEGSAEPLTCNAAVPGTTASCDASIAVDLDGDTRGTLALTSPKLALPRGTTAIALQLSDAVLPAASNVVTCPVPGAVAD